MLQMNDRLGTIRKMCGIQHGQKRFSDLAVQTFRDNPPLLMTGARPGNKVRLGTVDIGAEIIVLLCPASHVMAHNL